MTQGWIKFENCLSPLVTSLFPDHVTKNYDIFVLKSLSVTKTIPGNHLWYVTSITFIATGSSYISICHLLASTTPFLFHGGEVHYKYLHLNDNISPKYSAPKPPQPINLPIRHCFLVRSVNTRPDGNSIIPRGLRGFFVTAGAFEAAVFRFVGLAFVELIFLYNQWKIKDSIHKTSVKTVRKKWK